VELADDHALVELAAGDELASAKALSFSWLLRPPSPVRAQLVELLVQRLRPYGVPPSARSGRTSAPALYSGRGAAHAASRGASRASAGGRDSSSHS
jgi:hypothetical protein